MCIYTNKTTSKHIWLEVVKCLITLHVKAPFGFLMKHLTQLLSHMNKYFKNFLVTWVSFRGGVLVAKITYFLFPLFMLGL